MASKTQWLGLWNNREGVYSGQVISKKDIPAHARLIVRYNKYYEKDSNKPRFVYCFASGDAAKAITVKVEREEYMTLSEAEELSEKYCFSYDELQRLINNVAVAAGGSREYGEHIVSDFIYEDCTGIDTQIY